MKIYSPEEMINKGKDIVKDYNKFFLYGELGAGKTQFTKGIAKRLNIQPEKIQSPTYTYLNIYDNQLLHIDMYRLENKQDLIQTGILEEIDNFDYIVIEWPKFKDLFNSEEFINIDIKKEKDGTREINI